jgi:PAS domain S-box-containing protein
MNRTLGPGVGLGIGLLAALLVLNAGVSYRNTRQLDDDARWVAHTHEVLDALGDVLVEARGTTDRVAERVERVVALTADNPRQQARVPALRAAVADGSAAAVEAVVGVMADEERALLIARQAATGQTYRVAVLSGLIAAAVGLAAVALLLWLIDRRSLESARAAAVLAAERERFRATFEQAAVGVAHVAPDGRWLRANRRLAEKLGYTTDELAGLTFQNVTYPPDLEADEGQARRLLAGEIDSYALEKRYVRKDGSLVWANLTVSLVRRPGGEPDYFIAVVEDVSARKALEAELERRVEDRTRQLQEANAALEAFGHSAAHDLRAPLRNVQALAAALLEDHSRQLGPEGRHFAELILTVGRTMDALVTDLLAFSRLSRADIPRGAVDLAGVVAEAQLALGDAIRESDAEVIVDEPLPVVGGHRPILVQMVTNLVSNALKFVPPGSRPEVRVRATEAGGRVRLWVEDRGIGVPAADRERVFGPFERLHGEETYPGTGIGLAIVRKGAERMGGRAGVEPRPGGGSRFWVELPAAPGVEYVPAGGRGHGRSRHPGCLATFRPHVSPEKSEMPEPDRP